MSLSTIKALTDTAEFTKALIEYLSLKNKVLYSGTAEWNSGSKIVANITKYQTIKVYPWDGYDGITLERVDSKFQGTGFATNVSSGSHTSLAFVLKVTQQDEVTIEVGSLLHHTRSTAHSSLYDGWIKKIVGIEPIIPYALKTFGGGYGVTCTLRRWRYAVSKTVLAGCGKLREVYKECIDRKAEQGLEIHHRNNWNNFLRCKPIQRIISYSRFWRSLYSNIDTCCYLIFKCWKNTFCRNLWRKVNLCTYKPDIYCNGQSTGRIYSNHISLRQINSRGCCYA